MVISSSTIIRRSLQILWSKLDAYLKGYAKEGVVLAISGGPDSRALLEAIARWPNRSGGRYLVVSIDHGLRSQSAQESAYIIRRAQRLGFDTEIKTLPHLGTYAEHDLREMRYRALVTIARANNCASICTAHHLDDNAEGFVMSVLGSGGGAMGSAMNERDQIGGIDLLRPFLGISKKELLLSLTVLGQTDFATDNLDEAKKGQRAAVRHDLLPLLARKNHQINKRLDLFAKNQLKHAALLKSLSKRLINLDKNLARIDLSSRPDEQVVAYAIKEILKIWSCERRIYE